MNYPTPGYIMVDGWAGLGYIPVVIVGETPKRYRVRLLEDARLPGRAKTGRRGDSVLAPRQAVREGELMRVNGDWKPVKKGKATK